MANHQRRPSIQFYPGDWTSNANLMRCTHEEKGIWMDILCLMTNQNEHGLIRWTLKDIAQAVHTDMANLHSLIAKGVLKGHDSAFEDAYVYIPRSGRRNGPPVTLVPAQDGPLWFSSRMVKDEYVNKHAGARTRFKRRVEPEGIEEAVEQAETALLQAKSSPSRRQGAGPSSASSSSSSSSYKERAPVLAEKQNSGPDSQAPAPVVDDRAQVKARTKELVAVLTEAGQTDAHPDHPLLIKMAQEGLEVGELRAALVLERCQGKSLSYQVKVAHALRLEAALAPSLPPRRAAIEPAPPPPLAVWRDPNPGKGATPERVAELRRLRNETVASTGRTTAPTKRKKPRAVPVATA